MQMDRGLGRRKESFDQVADAYAEFRPAPPRDVIDAIVTASTLRRGSRVLEIGSGTGQLSVPLAQLDIELVAIELGPHLAALAERNLQRFPHAQVLVSSFEEWQLPARAFDAVISANAFHWLDPELRFSKCAAALRPGGALTILQVHHVRGGTPGFFADTQPYYRRWGLSDDPTFELPDPHELTGAYPELDRRIEFDAVERYRFEIPMLFTTDSYVGVAQNGFAGEQRRRRITPRFSRRHGAAHLAAVRRRRRAELSLRGHRGETGLVAAAKGARPCRVQPSAGPRSPDIADVTAMANRRNIRRSRAISVLGVAQRLLPEDRAVWRATLLPRFEQADRRR